ncbi:MAG: Gfo/Idh/MocA family protein [Kiritimatiellia bacterium]|jgi:predicted dehydrogenase
MSVTSVSKKCRPCASKAAKKPVEKKPAAKGSLPKLAIIGMGIQARTMLVPQFLGLPVAVSAICDCDKKRREAGVKQVDAAYAKLPEKKHLVGKCKAVADFRDVIRDKSIDMVVIAVPDHWHAYIAIEAMKAGKDVYCEKPLTYSIDEALLVVKAQKKYKRIFQTGAWQRSRREFRTACMIVRNGLVGDVKFVDCNYGQGTDAERLGGPSQPHRFFDDIRNAEKESAPNKDVDWDMWLGPAPWSPYCDQCAPRGVHDFFPMFWRFDDAYASGYNGDWGAHHLDIAQWALDLDKSGPVKIVRSDAPYSVNPIHGCRRQQGMEFVLPGGCAIRHNPFSTWGTVFFGSKGIVAVNRGKIAVWTGRGVKPTDAIRKQLADGTFKRMKKVAAFYGEEWGDRTDVQAGDGLGIALDAIEKHFRLDTAPVQLYKSVSQTGNFVECCRTRKAPVSPAETGARAAILCLLCNISYVYDVGFDWDPKRNTFANGTGDPTWLKRPCYRKGWEPKVD